MKDFVQKGAYQYIAFLAKRSEKQKKHSKFTQLEYAMRILCVECGSVFAFCLKAEFRRI